MAKPRALANKLTIALRHILDDRGIDLVAMQMEVYTKAMNAFDKHRGNNPEGSDAGVGYLGICNSAVATLAKYAFPTMTAIKLDHVDNSVNEKVIDAAKIRQAIMQDPFTRKAVDAATSLDIGTAPILSAGIKND